MSFASIAIFALAQAGGAATSADHAPHRVGFRSSWEFDAARKYDMTLADGDHYASADKAGGAGGPRPVLVNLWYPAEPAAGAAAMQYSEYLPSAAKIDSAPTATPAWFAQFVRELTAYEQDVIAYEVFGAHLKELTPAQRTAFDTFLAAPTACVRDAPPLPGPFPLVIYHAGYGSSVDDQSVWFERLAGAGYVVMGSAYEAADGKSFNIDAHAGSLGDFAFFIERASRLNFVDATRVAGIGHSGGAHTMLRWRVSEHCPARAIVSLDTTQDYYSIRDRRWSDMTDALQAHPERVTGPLLMCASPCASFELIDSLSAADRWYFTAPLEHDEFIDHGIFRLDHAPDHPALIPQTRASHEALYQFVKAFLDANLNGDRREFDRLALQHAPLADDGNTPHVEHAPPGVTRPDLYDPESKEPPTPRQLRPMLEADGLETTLDVLRRVHVVAPKHPIFNAQLAYGWTFELFTAGRVDDGRALHDLYREFDSDYSKLWFALCKYNEGFERGFALTAWRALVAYEPENAAAKARLGVMEGLAK